LKPPHNCYRSREDNPGFPRSQEKKGVRIKGGGRKSQNEKKVEKKPRKNVEKNAEKRSEKTLEKTGK
jgi:hypothetical protein